MILPPGIHPADIIKLSKLACWDVDMSKIVYENHAEYIIRKVFDMGTLDDVAEVVAFYGKNKVREALITAPYLREGTQYFASLWFGIPINSFKCSTSKQYHPVR